MSENKVQSAVTAMDIVLEPDATMISNVSKWGACGRCAAEKAPRIVNDQAIDIRLA